MLREGTVLVLPEDVAGAVVVEVALRDRGPTGGEAHIGAADDVAVLHEPNTRAVRGVRHNRSVVPS